MKYTIEHANEYAKNNKAKVNQLYYPKLHLTPQVGWMNDPNGLVYYNDTFHLFYQHYPYDSKWGPMHWAHATSKDLLSFKHESVALVPDKNLESGCFSGSAIEIDNVLYIMYTRHYEENGQKLQTICLAKSENGIDFEKSENPIFDNEELPDYLSRKDFRDPFIYKENDDIYVLLGAKNEKTNEGVIVVLKADTLTHLSYCFTIEHIHPFGDMGECPSLKKIGDNYLLLASGCNVVERDNSYKNVNSSVGIILNISFKDKKYEIKSVRELDKGDAFYAPQLFNNRNEAIMVGWMEQWGKVYPTDVFDHGYAGALNLPRVLDIKNDEITQGFINSLYESLTPTSEINNTCYIKLTPIKNAKYELKGDNGSLTIEYKDGYVYLDTTKANNLNGSIRRTDRKYNSPNIEIVLDKSSIEMIIDNYDAISSRFYMSGKLYLITNDKYEIKNIK